MVKQSWDKKFSGFTSFVIFILCLSFGSLWFLLETDHKFQNGQCIKIRITGQKGMIISLYAYSKKYRVRYLSTIQEKHEDGFVSQAMSSVNANSYAIEVFREYELEKWEE